MKKGLIVINAYSDLPPVLNQAARLKEEFLKFGVEISVKKTGSFPLYLDGNGKIICGGKADFCIFLDKDEYAAKLLEQSGMRLFNTASAIAVCDDKLQTHIALSKAGLPFPATIPAPLSYTDGVCESIEFLTSVAKKLGYPVIVKECYGSRGQNVYMAENFDELLTWAKKLNRRPHFYQRCIGESMGKDARVIVIGGKVEAAMLRTSQGDFRSNICLGGNGTKIEVDENLRSLCENAADALNLDYCGVDVLFAKGGYTICEVNSNAFFDGIELVTKVNVAKLYAEHVYRVIYGG